MISRADDFSGIPDGQLGNESDVKVTGVKWGDLLSYGVTKVSNEFTECGNISDGANTFLCLTLISSNYEGGIRDITILPGRPKIMGAPLTPVELFALRSECWEVIAGISNCAP